MITLTNATGLASGRNYNALRKTVAFTGAAGLGAVGTVALFTVTGAVTAHLLAICTESLATGAGATISVGTPAAVAGMIGVTIGIDIDIGEIWYAGAPATVLDTLGNSLLEYVIGNGADIQANVLVNPITDGTIVFNLWWMPLIDGASVVVA